MQTIKLRQTTKNNGSRKVTLKGYLERPKAMPSGPDQASVCDELGVRMGCVGWLNAEHKFEYGSPYMATRHVLSFFPFTTIFFFKYTDIAMKKIIYAVIALK